MPMDRSRNPGDSSSPSDGLCRVSYLYAKRPLLGNLLCALVGLLDGIALGDLLSGILQQILDLIEQINDILAGNLITI